MNKTLKLQQFLFSLNVSFSSSSMQKKKQKKKKHILSAFKTNKEFFGNVSVLKSFTKSVFIMN